MTNYFEKYLKYKFKYFKYLKTKGGTRLLQPRKIESKTDILTNQKNDSKKTANKTKKIFIEAGDKLLKAVNTLNKYKSKPEQNLVINFKNKDDFNYTMKGNITIIEDSLDYKTEYELGLETDLKEANIELYKADKEYKIALIEKNKIQLLNLPSEIYQTSKEYKEYNKAIEKVNKINMKITNIKYYYAEVIKSMRDFIEAKEKFDNDITQFNKASLALSDMYSGQRKK